MGADREPAQGPTHSLPHSLVATAAFGAGFLLLDHFLLWALKPQLAKLAAADQRPGRSKIVALQAVTKIVGTLHNVVQIFLALRVLTDPAIHADRLHARSHLSLLMLQISSGYFLQDLINCIMRYASEGPLFLLHATCCFTVFMYANVSDKLHYYGAAFLLWEVSTFNVHLRWLLIKLGKGSTKLFVYNGISMMVLFFCCRIVWGYHTSLQFYRDTREELSRTSGPSVIPPAVIHVFLVANLSLNSLNTYWFFLMLKGAVQALFGKSLSDVGRHKND